MTFSQGIKEIVMLKEKCSQVPNVAYLQLESDWVRTNTELEMAYFYKDEPHLIEEGYHKLANSISKKKKKKKEMKGITNSNHLPSITPKKTPNKVVDTNFSSLKSVTKVSTNDTSYTSSVIYYKRALLKRAHHWQKLEHYKVIHSAKIH